MNERDSEIICAMMMDEGYAPVSSYEEADLIIFNTCSVRKHAEDRVWGKLTQLAPLKKKGIVFGLVGCMGKAYEHNVFKKLPHVDFVCGPANIYDIPMLVDKVKAGKAHITATGLEKRPLKRGRAAHRDEAIRAWVSIGEGCNNFCSYCIVPYVRGREVSRPAQDIIDEISGLVHDGVKEVTLLGQNVNSYSLQPFPHFVRDPSLRDPERMRGAAHSSQPSVKNGFIDLLEGINKIKGLERIRFMTSHPKDVDTRFFKAMAQIDKVCEHLHLPLQSGSDSILKAMNRGYTVSDYLKLVDEARKQMPGIAITTDIIVGFPGEAEEDFKETYMLMEKIGFDSAFIFKYSPRPFTKASKMDDDVAKEAKEERNQALLNLQDKITTQKHEALVGTLQQALGIRGAKRKPHLSSDLSASYIKGRTRTNQQVVYEGDNDLIGSICNVRIRNVEDHTLIGEQA